MDIKNGRATLGKIRECAVEAGVFHALFIAFGTALGAMRPTPRTAGDQKINVRGLMEHDNDMDMGIFSEQITREQEEHYVDLLLKKGLFKAREEYERRDDTGRLLWCSLRPSAAPIGTKCCHWFFYKWKGYQWHSKGLRWLDERKFPSRKFPHSQGDAAIAKGIPEVFLNELMEITFEDMKFNIPVKIGSCCDVWYPTWGVPKSGGASATPSVSLIGKWNDEKTWKIF